MTVTNKYNQFTDSPVEARWYLLFKTMHLSTSHRRILNRQPVFNQAIFRDGFWFEFNYEMQIERIKIEDFNINFIALCN